MSLPSIREYKGVLVGDSCPCRSGKLRFRKCTTVTCENSGCSDCMSKCEFCGFLMDPERFCRTCLTLLSIEGIERPMMACPDCQKEYKEDGRN